MFAPLPCTSCPIEWPVRWVKYSPKPALRITSLDRKLASDEPLDLEPAHELASLFIHALETGTEREIHVNIRNGGLITSLPDNCCVEVPCLVGAGTPRPVAPRTLRSRA